MEAIVTPLSATQLSMYVENQMQGLVSNEGLYNDTPWFKNALSDHVPVLQNVYGMVVVSFNVLNPAYVHHITKDAYDNKREGQRLDKQWFVQERSHPHRFGLIVRLVKEWIECYNNIVCLQEVSPTLLEILKVNMQDCYFIVTRKSSKNCNVSIFSSTHFSTAGAMVPVIRNTEPDEKGVINPEEDTHYVTVTTRATGFTFNLLNVHVKFEQSEQSVKDFANIDSPHPTIVAGDLNASSRWPKGVVRNPHVSIYDHERFFFPFPSIDRPVYTSVNKVMNLGLIKSTFMMYDKIDYVFIILPKQVLATLQ